MTHEANAISTAFLRADLLAEPYKQDLQETLLHYANTRLTAGQVYPDRRGAAENKLAESLRIQGKLWPLALEATEDPLPPATRSLVLSAINDVLDAHMVHIATLPLPISKYSNAMTFAAALAAVTLLGNRTGMPGRRLTWRTFAFTSFLSIVILTIVDTRRVTEGLIVMNDAPMRATIVDMKLALE